MAKTTGLKPGQKAPASGLYRVRGPRGGRGNEVTVVRGEPMPPSPKPKMTYDLMDPADNKSGQVK
ncbi:MAG: hypothetical protein WBG50_18885 [Desulfomonilaceae bacterium]